MLPVAYAQSVVAEASKQGLDETTSLVLNKLPFIVIAFVILLVSFFIGRMVKNAAQRAIVRSGRHEGAMSVVGKSLYIGCVILGFTIALKITGVDISFI